MTHCVTFKNFQSCVVQQCSKKKTLKTVVINLKTWSFKTNLWRIFQTKNFLWSFSTFKVFLLRSSIYMIAKVKKLNWRGNMATSIFYYEKASGYKLVTKNKFYAVFLVPVTHYFPLIFLLKQNVLFIFIPNDFSQKKFLFQIAESFIKHE